jgi:hypothetical protein
MAHDWSHNIDRKTVSNIINKNRGEQTDYKSAIYSSSHLLYFESQSKIHSTSSHLNVFLAKRHAGN